MKKTPQYMKNFKMFELRRSEEDTKSKSKNVDLLNKIGKNMTEMAKNDELEPVIGRDNEIFQVLWILSRKMKNNPVIIGEAGVGKTAIVEGIAQRIVSGDCPDTLKNMQIYYINMGSLLSGAPSGGMLEARVEKLLEELEENKDIILFIDEIHLIVNPNASIDVANMFKPALSRGKIRLIGATTYNEFRNSIEKDSALDRRFQKVIIKEPTEEETINILNQIKHKYEEYHNVEYTDEAIQYCVRLSGRYITDRYFPDKAIDLLDEVGAKIRLSNVKRNEALIKAENELLEIKNKKIDALKNNKFEEANILRKKENDKLEEIERITAESKEPPIKIDSNEVSNIISLKTGIPVKKLTQDEGEKLLAMESELKLAVIGQDEAVSKISKYIRRSRVGLKDKNRPGGVFLFLGTTGTGKTHTVKMLAKYIFGSENDLIRVDMSEYREKHTVSRLIGSPPGYVGYNEAGQLTEKVRRKPYSIVLLDEIEKAHPDVLNIFLQVFDEGHLTDAQGRKVDFKNTIIIMTSNVGARETSKAITPVGFGDKKVVVEENKKSLIKAALYDHFAPEFINRIDEIIFFNTLEKESIYKIIDLEIDKLAKKLKDMNYTLTITDNVKDLLIDVGYDQSMGARPLKRAIQTYIEDPISDEILKKKIKDKVDVDYDKEQNKLIINGELITERRRIKNWKQFKRLF